MPFRRLQKALRLLRTAGTRGLIGHVGAWLVHWSQRRGSRTYLSAEIDPRPIDDSYLHWIMPTIGGWLHSGNLVCFNHALQHLPAGSAILEIGSFCGLSTTVIAHLRAQAGLDHPFFACDRWDMSPPDALAIQPSPLIPAARYSAFVKDSFIRNLRQFGRGDLPFALELWSDEFFTAWRTAAEVQDVFGRTVRLGGALGFAYIDGNHTYASVRRDFENVHEFLARGGYVLFDDSSDTSSQDPTRVALEVSRRPDYELIAKNPNCLFCKRR